MPAFSQLVYFCVSFKKKKISGFDFYLPDGQQYYSVFGQIWQFSVHPSM